MISYFQALILGLLQGATELFPISSLGHSVLLPWLFNWNGVLSSETSEESFLLPFLVALHVATAFALLIFYREAWIRIIIGFFRSLKTRKTSGDPDARLAWLLILATIPAGVFGLALEHKLRTLFTKPLAAMIFIIINGFILLAADNYIQNHKVRQTKDFRDTADQISEKVTIKRALIIGTSQIGALFAGISRSGVTMTSGMYSGLNTEDAARFSFLLATPIILGAGILKLPDFFSNLDSGVWGQILLGSVAAFVAAYMTVKYLDKYFQNKRLRPFGFYCIGLGVCMILLGLIRGHF